MSIFFADLKHWFVFQLKGKGKQVKADNDAENMLKVEGSSANALSDNLSPVKVDDGSRQLDDEMGDSDWEDGSNPTLNSENDRQDLINKGITIEFDSSPGTSKRKPVRRATAEEKVNCRI